nr:high affinity immunoglobulin gamma Fc receptor I-like [Labrus bergylta]
MDTVVSLLVLLALPHFVAPQVVAPYTSFRTRVELVSGDSRIFSGENVQLKCSVPIVHTLSWNYLWYRGSEKLHWVGEHLHLWDTKVKDSGKYYCQGVRETLVGDILTLQSLPVEINVDGGWAILQVSPNPSLVGNTLKATCRVRGEPQLNEVILYKNGFEVMRQRGLDPTFHLPIMALEDQGRYSCRASWDAGRQTRSVISAKAPVQVLEVLSQPVLEIVADSYLIPEKKMKLICHHQYNAPAPAPPVHYYFYESDIQLGTATSENHNLVKRTPGNYRCKARVPQLGLSKWSSPKAFGQMTGSQTMMPPILHPRESWPLAPRISLSDCSLSPAAEPTKDKTSPQRSTATSSVIQPIDVSTKSSVSQLNPSQLPPSTLLSTVHPIKQTTLPKPVKLHDKSAELSREPAGMPKESGGNPKRSWDIPEGSGDWSKRSWDMPEGSGDWSEGSGDWSEGSGDMPEGSGVLY